MPYNGAGVFSVYTPGTPYVTGTVISSSVANLVNSDFATGLSTAICKDGQTTITANIPMAGFKLTGLGAATGNGQAIRYEQVGTLVAASGANSDITSLSAVTGISTAAGVAIHGTNTNNAAAAGYVGELVESIVASASAVSSTGSGQWFDVTSISLTAGDWDISAVVMQALNGATSTACQALIGTVAGNNNTGLSYGLNATADSPPGSAVDKGMAIPSYPVSIASTTIYYLKSLFSFSAGTPKAYGRISARRVR